MAKKGFRFVTIFTRPDQSRPRCRVVRYTRKNHDPSHPILKEDAKRLEHLINSNQLIHSQTRIKEDRIKVFYNAEDRHD